MDKAEYKKNSINSVKIADTMRFDKRNVVIAFEGMDAAGKGGAIKRIVKTWTRVNMRFTVLGRLNVSKQDIRICGVFGIVLMKLKNYHF